MLREKCLYLGFFWSVFFRIRTGYGEIRSISPYSVRMRENRDQENSEYGHFSSSAVDVCIVHGTDILISFKKLNFHDLP